MKKIVLFLLLFFLLDIRLAHAVRVIALYQASIPVTSQSASERNQVMAQGLEQVLIKVSGNNQILANPKIKAYLNSANNLMEEFSYLPVDQSMGVSTPYLLQLNFDPEGVNKVLREASIPIWGQNRPLLLMWLEYEMPNRVAEIISANAGNNIPAMFKQIADRRGVPVLFPAMDVEDLNQISVNDIVTMTVPKLTTAAKRYASDAILIGRIMYALHGYNTQWKLVMGNDQWAWNITSKTIPDALTELVNQVANTLASRYATVVTNTVQSALHLKITHISQPEDFNQVINYLKHLTPVADVQLLQVAGDELLLQVSLRGTPASFLQAISVGQKLIPLTTTTPQANWTYQWNP